MKYREYIKEDSNGTKWMICRNEVDLKKGWCANTVIYCEDSKRYIEHPTDFRSTSAATKKEIVQDLDYIY